MNGALEMLEYTTILNQIAELTHTEAARRRALELRPTKDLALIYQRAHWIGQAAHCLEVSAPPLTAITGVEAALPLLKLNEILSTDQLTKLGMFRAIWVTGSPLSRTFPPFRPMCGAGWTSCKRPRRIRWCSAMNWATAPTRRKAWGWPSPCWRDWPNAAR